MIGRLRSHLETGNALEKDWYDGLIAHLEKRTLTPEEREMLDRVLRGELEPTHLASMEKTEVPLDPVEGPEFSWIKLILGLISFILLIIQMVIEYNK